MGTVAVATGRMSEVIGGDLLSLHQRSTLVSYSLAVTTLAAVNLTLGTVELGTILPHDPIT